MSSTPSGTSYAKTMPTGSIGPSTWIATPGGERAVETLAPGDLLLTADGRAVPLLWLGRQTLHRALTQDERYRPVRIAAGALGAGLPHTDLVVTADHALHLDGVLCHAGALVNGTTIVRVPAAELGASHVVFHIETEGHEILLANDVPAETFIDHVSRRAFDNVAEFDALGLSPAPARAALPRAHGPRQLPAALRARLALEGSRQAA